MASVLVRRLRCRRSCPPQGRRPCQTRRRPLCQHSHQPRCPLQHQLQPPRPTATTNTIASLPRVFALTWHLWVRVKPTIATRALTSMVTATSRAGFYATAVRARRQPYQHLRQQVHRLQFQFPRRARCRPPPRRSPPHKLRLGTLHSPRVESQHPPRAPLRLELQHNSPHRYRPPRRARNQPRLSTHQIIA